MNQTIRRVSWIDWLIFASSVLFILVLALSAFYDPSIRVLHLFQALIYVAVILLTRRGSAWGTALAQSWLHYGTGRTWSTLLLSRSAWFSCRICFKPVTSTGPICLLPFLQQRHILFSLGLA
ncbi:MAG: hypothetical protein IH846_08935 [Acidobacteria bacterium]|nr:hypothetical protein [Acidobacteriota bacterium]